MSIDPAPRLQSTAYGRITDIARLLGEIMANEVDRPAILDIAEVAGTLGQQVLKLGRDVLAFGGRTPGLRGVLKSWESRSWVSLEPGADGVFIAV